MKINRKEEYVPAKYHFYKDTVTIDKIGRQVKGIGFLKQEIMYSCPHCQSMLGFSRCKFTT